MEHQWASLDFNGRREDGVFHRQIRFFEADPDPEEMQAVEIVATTVSDDILSNLAKVLNNINEDEIGTVLHLSIEKDCVEFCAFPDGNMLEFGFGMNEGAYFWRHGAEVVLDLTNPTPDMERLAPFVGEKDLRTWLSKVFAYDILDEY